MKKQLVSNRYFIMIMVVCCLATGLPCMAQTDTLTLNWKEAKHEKVSFKYPKDWLFEKQTERGFVFLTLKPDYLSDLDVMKSFELVVTDKQGYTFEAYKKDFIRSVSARYNNDVAVLRKKDTVVTGRKAIYAEVSLYPKTSPVPVKIYTIDGGNKFYLVTMVSNTLKYGDIVEFDRIQDAIFKSVVIQK